LPGRIFFFLSVGHILFFFFFLLSNAQPTHFSLFAPPLEKEKTQFRLLSHFANRARTFSFFFPPPPPPPNPFFLRLLFPLGVFYPPMQIAIFLLPFFFESSPCIPFFLSHQKKYFPGPNLLGFFPPLLLGKGGKNFSLRKVMWEKNSSYWSWRGSPPSSGFSSFRPQNQGLVPPPFPFHTRKRPLSCLLSNSYLSSPPMNPGLAVKLFRRSLKKSLSSLPSFLSFFAAHLQFFAPPQTAKDSAPFFTAIA